MFGLEMAFDCSEVEELSPYALYEMETLEMCDGIHVVEFHLRRFSILNTGNQKDAGVQTAGIR